MTPHDALQTALAGEYAAVYVYGVLGGRVSDSSDPGLAERLDAAYVVHRGRRDHLVSRVHDHGGTPVAPSPSYRVPTPARTAAQLRKAARVLEQRCAEVYADAVGATTGGDRAWAAGALVDAAVRGLGFGAGAEAFPGAGDL